MLSKQRKTNRNSTSAFACPQIQKTQNKTSYQYTPGFKGVGTGVLVLPGVRLRLALPAPPPAVCNFSLLSVLTTKPPRSKAVIPRPFPAALAAAPGPSKYDLCFGLPREKSGDKLLFAGVAQPDVRPVRGGSIVVSDGRLVLVLASSDMARSSKPSSSESSAPASRTRS